MVTIESCKLGSNAVCGITSFSSQRCSRRVSATTTRNSTTAPNTAPNEIVKSPMRMPRVAPLIASNRSAAATSQRPIASARTTRRPSARPAGAGGDPPEQAEPARLDAQLARKLAAAGRVGRERAVDHRIGHDQEQIKRRDQRDGENDAARDERREARIAGK